MEYLQQIQHNEVFEHRLAEAINRLRETLDELTVQKKGIKRLGFLFSFLTYLVPGCSSKWTRRTETSGCKARQRSREERTEPIFKTIFKVKKKRSSVHVSHTFHIKDGLEKMVDALRQALRGAEEQNTRMQETRRCWESHESLLLDKEENKAGADNFRLERQKG